MSLWRPIASRFALGILLALSVAGAVLAQTPPVTVTPEQLARLQKDVPGLTVENVYTLLQARKPGYTVEQLIAELDAYAAANQVAAVEVARLAALRVAQFSLPARNRVLIYNNTDQPNNQFANFSQDFAITFIGTGGTSIAYKMDDYYVGQAWLRTDGTASTSFPPYATRYSGTLSATIYKHGPVDMLNVPIPANIGPIIGVYINTKVGLTWKIDKIVADGRTFSFSGSTDPLRDRYSAHYVLGGGNNAYARRPSTWDSNVAMEQCMANQLGGTSVVLPPDLFPNPGTYILPHAKIEALAKTCHDSYVRPPWKSLYSEPTLASQTKRITVRLALGGGVLVNETRDVGPPIDVQLVGPSTTSSTQQTDGTLVFGQEFATLTVPGDFQVTGLNVTLRKGRADGKPLDIVYAGMTVEEGLGPEVQIQDAASLVLNTPVKMRLYGNSAVLDVASLKVASVVTALAGRSSDAIFHGIGANAGEMAAIDEFRSYSSANFLAQRVPAPSTGQRFDFWFLQSNDEIITSTELIAAAQAHFRTGTLPQATTTGWITARPKLQLLIDNRLSALKYLDALKLLGDYSRTTLNSEVALAQLKLSLDTPIASCSGLPATQDDTGAFLSVVNAALSIATVTPAGEAFTGLSALFGAAAYAEPLTGGSSAAAMSPPPVCDAGANVNSLFKDTLGNLAGNLGHQLDGLYGDGGALDALRPTVVRDASLLQSFALSYLDYQTKLSSGGGAMSATALSQFQATSGLEMRRVFATALLPIRTVIHGEQTNVLFDSNSSTSPPTPYTTGVSGLLVSMFPPQKPWPTLQDIDAASLCSSDSTCPDHIMAYSAAFVLDNFQPPGITSYVVRPTFHQWRLAFWEGGQNPPTMLPSDVWTNYLSDIFTTDDVFAMLSSVPGRMTIGEWQYQCNFNNPYGPLVSTDGVTPAQDLRALCSVPRTSSENIAQSATDAVFLYPMPVWQNGGIADRYTMKTPDGDYAAVPQISGRAVVRWDTTGWPKTVRSGFGSDSAIRGSDWVSSIDFPMHQYSDSNRIGPILPTAWVRIH